jgi:hypothetical protein
VRTRSQRLGYRENHAVEKFRSLEHLKAQITVVRWHLDAAVLGNGDTKRRHLDSASLTYQGALELLAQLALTGREHAAVKAQLAALAERLRAAGQTV